MSSRAVTDRVAVFSRNHREYLDEATAVAKRDPSKRIVFRSRDGWATAGREVARVGPVAIYFSAAGAEGQVEYAAELCGVLRGPLKGSPETEKWLSQALPSTLAEGLWEPPAATLYAIRNCRKLRHPFPMTRLIKVSDQKPISPNYGYSYSVVRALRGVG
jgi:hypothetical protein